MNYKSWKLFSESIGSNFNLGLSQMPVVGGVQGSLGVDLNGDLLEAKKKMKKKMGLEGDIEGDVDDEEVDVEDDGDGDSACAAKKEVPDEAPMDEPMMMKKKKMAKKKMKNKKMSEVVDILASDMESVDDMIGILIEKKASMTKDGVFGQNIKKKNVPTGDEGHTLASKKPKGGLSKGSTTKGNYPDPSDGDGDNANSYKEAELIDHIKKTYVPGGYNPNETDAEFFQSLKDQFGQPHHNAYKDGTEFKEDLLLPLNPEDMGGLPAPGSDGVNIPAPGEVGYAPEQRIGW